VAVEKEVGAIQMIRGRFAPSPTGGLHLGNARTALAAWLSTRSREGIFILRNEDLDRQRCKPGVSELNLSELQWLGLDWDEGPDVSGPWGPYHQSKRHAYYAEVLAQLREWVYPCYLSRKEVQAIASAPHGPIEGYGLKERELNQILSFCKQQEGKTPSLRFRGPQQKISFHDALQGPQAFEVGDFILRRADGEWAYQLAVVADDLAMQITEVVRGDDLLPSTAAQIVIYQALGQPPPQFLHLPLLLDSEGNRLSKRKGDLTLHALRHSGIASHRVLGFLAYSLGLLPELLEVSLYEVLKTYRIEQLNTSPYCLQNSDLEWLGVGCYNT